MLQKIRKYYSRLTGESLIPKKSYLCSVFLMCNEEELEVAPIQFDFFHPDEYVITSYRFEGESMIVQPKSEVFMEAKTKVKKLDLDKDIVDFDQVYLKAKEPLKAYNESVDKLIILLQCLNDNIVWNITFITKTFNMFHVQINAESLEVIKKEYSSLLNFKK